MSRAREMIAVGFATLLLAVAAVAGTLGHAGAAPAPSATTSSITASDGWARINPVAGHPSAAYVTLRNTGVRPETLVGVTAPMAGRVELHQHQVSGIIMRMVKVDRLVLAPGAVTEMGPGGYHLMLFDLKSQPKPGTRLPLTLTFASGTKLEVEIIARGLAATGPAISPAPPMDHRDHHPMAH
jgi:periplasmic copper chaperone A